MNTTERPIDIAIRLAGSQTALADKAGITQPCISKLYSGKSKRMDPETAIKIADALNIPKHILRPDIFDRPAA